MSSKSDRKPAHEAIVDSLLEQLRLRKDAGGFQAKHDCGMKMTVLLDLLTKVIVPPQHIDEVARRLDLIAQEARDSDDHYHTKIQSAVLDVRKP